MLDVAAHYWDILIYVIAIDDVGATDEVAMTECLTRGIRGRPRSRG